LISYILWIAVPSVVLWRIVNIRMSRSTSGASLFMSCHKAQQSTHHTHRAREREREREWECDCEKVEEKEARAASR